MFQCLASRADTSRHRVVQAAIAGVLYDMIFFDVDALTEDKVRGFSPHESMDWFGMVWHRMCSPACVMRRVRCPQKGVMAPPPHMCTLQFLSLVLRLLDDGGVAVFNVLHSDGSKRADEHYLADFVYNCCQVFAGVVVLLSVDGTENRVVACWNYQLPSHEAQKLSVDGRRVTETLSGPDLTHRLKRLVRNRPMLKSLMQKTRIGLLPLTEVLGRRSTSPEEAVKA